MHTVLDLAALAFRKQIGSKFGRHSQSNSEASGFRVVGDPQSLDNKADSIPRLGPRGVSELCYPQYTWYCFLFFGRDNPMEEPELVVTFLTVPGASPNASKDFIWGVPDSNSVLDRRSLSCDNSLVLASAVAAPDHQQRSSTPWQATNWMLSLRFPLAESRFVAPSFPPPPSPFFPPASFPLFPPAFPFFHPSSPFSSSILAPVSPFSPPFSLLCTFFPPCFPFRSRFTVRLEIAERRRNCLTKSPVNLLRTKVRVPAETVVIRSAVFK